MNKKSDWFSVDKEGLAKILSKKGIEFALFELIQNAWDQNVTKVSVSLHPEKNGKVIITVVDDDPAGFHDLTHAYTLFAESAKKTDPLKRGKFNLGEKLVFALAESATIVTTTGSVEFNKNGRHNSSVKTEVGSIITVLLKMTTEEIDRINSKINTLIPSVTTYFNETTIPERTPVASFETTLDTEIADANGYLKKSPRKTTVRVFEPKSGEIGTLYEMGIPVVETGDKWHYDVCQKIPLNLDRDNVPPQYLRTLRTFAFNALFDKTTKEDANNTWVRDALSDPRCNDDAVKAAVKNRFGDKVVIYDNSDPEANKLAVLHGYTVVHGGHLSHREWENIHRSRAIIAAGSVTPSPKPYSENGDPLKVIDRYKWTNGMLLVETFAKEMAQLVFGHSITAMWVNDFKWNFAATYGPGGPLTLNKSKISKDLYESGITREMVALLIHEFAHEYESDHLSKNFYRSLCKIGSYLAGWTGDSLIFKNDRWITR